MRPAKTPISLGIRPFWSVFAVRMKKARVLSYPLSAQRRLWSDWAGYTRICDYFLSELMLHAKMCNVRTYVINEYARCSARIYVTHENMMYLNLYYIRKCVMSEPMLHTKVWCLVFRTYIQNLYQLNVLHTNMRLLWSELMLHTKMSNDRTYVPRIWDVFCPNLCNIRKYNMSEHMLHTKIWCLVLYTKRYNVRTCVAQKIWCLVSELMPVTYKMCNVRTYVTRKYAIIFCPN